MKLQIDLRSITTDDEVTDHPARVKLESLLHEHKGKLLNVTITVVRDIYPTPNNTGEKVKEVFTKLDDVRGYRPPKRNAEAASIIRMLKQYTPEQIITTYQCLKSDIFWQGKELYMMSVESQIGAVVKSQTRTPQSRYSHMVK